MTEAWCETNVINGNESSALSLCLDQQLFLREHVNIYIIFLGSNVTAKSVWDTWKGLDVSTDWENLLQRLSLLLLWNIRSSSDGPERMNTCKVPESLMDNRKIVFVERKKERLLSKTRNVHFSFPKLIMASFCYCYRVKRLLGTLLVVQLFLEQTELCHRIFSVLHKVKQVIHDYMTFVHTSWGSQWGNYTR